MVENLDSRGILALYKAQVRPSMEYGALSWLLRAANHMQRLGAVKRQALRLMGTDAQQPLSASETPLKHRRDVSGLSALVVCRKAQVQEVPHLGRLRIPPRAARRETKTAISGDELREAPGSYSRQHQRTHTSRTSRLWNKVTAATPDMSHMPIHQVRVAVHR